MKCTNREQELNKVKEIITKKFKDGNCGLYNTRNLVGDSMATIFKGDYFQIDICYYYSYFEVFGTTDEEFDTLYKYYNKLKED